MCAGRALPGVAVCTQLPGANQEELDHGVGKPGWVGVPPCPVLSGESSGALSVSPVEGAGSDQVGLVMVKGAVRVEGFGPAVVVGGTVAMVAWGYIASRDLCPLLMVIRQ